MRYTCMSPHLAQLILVNIIGVVALPLSVILYTQFRGLLAGTVFQICIKKSCQTSTGNAIVCQKNVFHSAVLILSKRNNVPFCVAVSVAHTHPAQLL